MKSRNLVDIDVVFIDKLGLSVLIQLLKHHGLRKIYCLDGLGRRHTPFQFMLKLKGIEVADAQFFAGQLKTHDGESVYLAARRIAGRAAFAASKQIILSEPMLERLNIAYGRNTIQLFIAKILARHIEEWTSRAFVADAISLGANPILWLRKPVRFSEKTLLRFLPNVNLRFYSYEFGGLLDVAETIFGIALRFCKLVASGYVNRQELRNNGKPGVLLLQEETIRARHVLRNQLYWLDIEGELGAFETHVLTSSLESEIGIEQTLGQKGVTLMPSAAALGSAWLTMRCDNTLLELRQDRVKAYLAALSARTPATRIALIKVGFLLWQSELMGAISKALGVRVFVTKEPYFAYADAMQLCAEQLGVKTIAIQYSNLGAVSPVMMTTADRLLIFSDMYRRIFTVADISPKELVSIGYLHDGIGKLVNARAALHRSLLQASGARFVVCYFDESVQHDRWGLVSNESHLSELHCITRRVLEDTTFGLVIKSQFIRNSPSQLYPNDELIRQAKATGRYLELIEGKHRNDIYPTEAALSSDLCIGHKFGATASLEAAVAGVRSVILDSYGTRTEWDALYSSANIEFKSIDDVLEAIIEYRHGAVRQLDLGDWTPILGHFVSRHDGKSIEVTRNLIAGWTSGLPDEIIA